MIYSPTRYLEVVKSRINHELVSPTALAYLQANFAKLPLVSSMLLECRLGKSELVDFSVQFLGNDASRPLFTKRSNHIFSNSEILDNYVWQRVQQFCVQWEQSELLNTVVSNIWLEFDVNDSSPHIPVPGLFIMYEKLPSVTDLHTLRSRHYQAAKLALETLLTKSLPPLLQDTIDICCESLPGESCIASVGAMLSRDSVPVKLCIADISTEQILPYLHNVGWAGCYDAIKNFLNEVIPYLDRIVLQLDIANGQISRKVGFECYLIEQNPQKEGRWHLLLDYLISTGHCTANKKDALLKWHGSQYNIFPHEQVLDFIHGPCCLNVLVRRINHIKIAIHPDSSYEAKAYLWITRGWVTT